jgi:hypothetical protein
MGPITKERIAETLNLLPEVRWDRYLENHEGGWDCYGWIDRPDGRSDFALIRFDVIGLWLEFWTSSAEHSRSIFERLNNSSAEDHNDCVRIDETFGALVPNTTTSRAA